MRKKITLSAEEAEGVVVVLRQCAAVLRKNIGSTLVVGSGSTLWTGIELSQHAAFAAKVVNGKRKASR